MTCFLLASKYEELDENITLIKDLRRYYTRVLPTSVIIPSFDDIIKCEGDLMRFFNWDLMIVTPTNVLKLLLANGVIFENEKFQNKLLVASKVTTLALQLLELLVKELQ